MSRTLAAVHLRRGAEEDTTEILTLMRASLGDEVPHSRAFWRWKHEENPFGASPVLVAEANGKVVGLRAFMRWHLRSGRQTVPAVRAVDAVTHPDWRGQGIFTRLTLRLIEEMQEEGVAFVFSTPNDRSRPGHLKMGWTLVKKASQWIRPISISRMAQALAHSEIAGPASPSMSLSTVEELLAAPQFDAFLQRCAPDDPQYTTLLTGKYIRWRYAHMPGVSYHAAWRLDGDTGSVLIFRFRETGRGLRALILSEVLIGSSRREQSIAKRLLGSLFRESNADYVLAKEARSLSILRILAACGFLPIPRMGPHFTVRSLNVPANTPDPHRRSNWRHSIGDLELF